MTKKNTAARSSRADREGRPQAAPGVTWWRTKPAEAFDESTAQQLRRTLSTIAILEVPTWRAAAGGDGAAAVGLALRLDPQRVTINGLDLVMTALAACAAEGDAAACLTMSHCMRRFFPTSKREARLATSWLVRTFAMAIKRAKPRKGGVS
ncbi:MULTISPECIES: hypothetical protein [Bradyrhizobium]|uniref:hypothetical protein n=1 Tax=Bradyrhizobium TaxID=374 RepID=UPI0019596D83|nr:hypothetical protein [Bradyrhizobium canariense]MBM7486065.1 hypothetical protein [Bradyrhizobium canariense]UFW72911.1 hypothetical protein BcanWU425_03830 [Bradyrhizobium canariense]